MKRSKSSRRWLDRHFSDDFVKQAQARGYRSRAAFKLLELQEKDRLLRPGMRVVDLGAAPGGWTQVARELVGDAGRVVALDLLPIDPLGGVEIVQGDFRDETTLAALRERLGGDPVDLVISDMAPNVTGNRSIDQPRAIYLAELALELVREVLRPGGSFVTKIFQGAGFDAYLKALRERFATVRSRKPRSSRPESRELYLVARNYNPE